MCKLCLHCTHILFLMFCITPLHAGWHERKAEGWAWYEERNTPKLKEALEEEKTVPISASNEMEIIRKALEDKLAKAILHPSNENVLTYMNEQKKWVEKSSDFATTWAHLLLSNPYLDHTVTGRPVSQYGLQFQKNLELERRDFLIASLAKDHGLMFFYEGKNPASQYVGEIVQGFSEKYEWQTLFVSVDGKILEQFENNKIDNGISKSMGIDVFPALVVVEPKNNVVNPIAFGLVSTDKIEENIVLQFQGLEKGDLR